MKERKKTLIWLGIAIIVLAAVMLIGGNVQGFNLHPDGDQPFGGMLEMKEWLAEYEVPVITEPVFGKKIDCDDYAYYLAHYGDLHNKMVHWQLEVWDNKDMDDEGGYKHLFVSVWILNERGQLYARFIDAETKRIYKKMYGYMWRVD